MNSKTRAEAVFFVSSFFNSLVFFAPVAILVRTRCGITLSQFFILQALLSFGIFADSGLVPQCRFFKVIVTPPPQHSRFLCLFIVNQHPRRKPPIYRIARGQLFILAHRKTAFIFFWFPLTPPLCSHSRLSRSMRMAPLF